MSATSSGDMFAKLQNSRSATLYKIGLWVKRLAQKHPAGTSSLIFHFLIFIFAVSGLPSFFKREAMTYNVITVEMVPLIREVTNIRTEPKKEIKKEIPKEQKAAPPIKQLQIKPETPPRPPAIPKVKPEPVPKPVEKKKEKPKEKEKEQPDFESVLKSIKQMEREEKKQKPAEFNPELPLSMSEVDAIINQISKCWAVPAGARNAEDISVLLRISLAIDGTVTSVKIVEQSRYNKADETFFRAAADAAVRAVKGCSPLKNLPPEKYKNWSELELNFDPQEMFH